MATRERSETDPLDWNPDSLTTMLNRVERSTASAENHEEFVKDCHQLLEQGQSMSKTAYIVKLEGVVRCLIRRTLRRGAFYKEVADTTRTEINRNLSSQLGIPLGEIDGETEEA